MNEIERKHHQLTFENFKTHYVDIHGYENYWSDVFSGLQIKCVFLITIMPILSNHMFDHNLESSHRGNSNKW